MQSTECLSVDRVETGGCIMEGKGKGLHLWYQVSPALFKRDGNASMWGRCAN